MNIVKLSDEELSLSSGLSAESFAKTNFSEFLNLKSSILHFEKNSFSVEDYQFSLTKADSAGIISFVGKSFDGKAVSDILSLSNERRNQNDNFSLYVFSKSLDFLAEKMQEISIFDENFLLGGGGILIKSDFESQIAEILFLNPKIFEICAQNHKKNYANLQGKYIYKGLDSFSSLYFLHGVVAYKSISGNFPFDENETTKRQEDIFDENFAPIDFWNDKISENLKKSIESSLKLKIDSEIFAGKRALKDSKSEKKRQEILENAMKFDSDEFYKLISGDNASSEALTAKREKFIKKQRIFVSAKRFLRRNKNRILASFAAIFVIFWFVSGILRENAKLITTKGLSSVQTVHAFYTAIHRSDVPSLQEIVSGKETKDLMIKVSGYFVSAKQRLETNPDNGVLSPAKWFFYKKASKSWMLGITNLKIDGKDFKIESDYPKKKDKPIQITEDNGKILKKGDETTVFAEYFFVHQAEVKFFIEKITDKVTLRWNGKMWKVVKVEGKSKIENLKSKDFIDDYYARLEENENAEKSKIQKVLEILRKEYDWIPSEDDMTDAAKFLSTEYDSIEAKKFLGE